MSKKDFFCKRVKTRTAPLDKYIRRVDLEAMQLINHCPYSHTLNEETLRSMEDIEKEIGLTESESIEDLFRKLGID